MSNVEDVLKNPELKAEVKVNKLHHMAFAALDADDSAGFEECVTAIRTIEEYGQKASYIPTRAVSLMYAKKPQILILKEKYDPRYFDISTPDLFAKAFLSVLKERLEQGWYSSGDPYVPNEIETLFLYFLDGNVPALAGLVADIPVGDSFKPFREVWSKAPLTQQFRNRRDGLGTYYAYINKLGERPGDHDLEIAYMSYLIASISEKDHGSLRKFLDGKGGPLTALLRRKLNKDDDAWAIEILQSVDLSLRRAGREAYRFMQEREGHQYEGFLISHLEVPDFAP